MALPVETLIDGVVRALQDAVLPAVGSRVARGQLYAAIDVLRNLRDRVDMRADLLVEEAVSAADALERAMAALRAGAAADAAAVVEAALRLVPAEPPAARADALRQALVTALDALAPRDDEAARAARAAIGAHLAAQAMRELALLKPSLLAEISRG